MFEYKSLQLLQLFVCFYIIQTYSQNSIRYNENFPPVRFYYIFKYNVKRDIQLDTNIYNIYLNLDYNNVPELSRSICKYLISVDRAVGIYTEDTISLQ